ncbi:hypothetical protein LTR70_009363 [Exophiala xenobiotica]|nr:hypothetical protein LTR70_009363 [Exophiala xenobiotica]
MAFQQKQVAPHRKIQLSANESSPIYETLRLSPEKKEIRLLELLPGSTGDIIRCRMIATPLRGAPEYSAVSYVWGHSHSSLQISVNGNAFAVRENTFQALSQLRLEDTVRMIWVDSICIDQGNIEEKQHQLRLMHDVYSQAGAVLVWLGAAAADSEIAMSFLHTVVKSGKVELTAASAGMLSAADEATWASPTPLEEFGAGFLGRKHHDLPSPDGQVALLPPGVHLRAAIKNLLLRPWFQRRWILQEALLAQNIILVCGSSEVKIHRQHLKQLSTRDQLSSQSSSLIDFSLSSDRPNSKTRLHVEFQVVPDDTLHTGYVLLDPALALRLDSSSLNRASSPCPSLSGSSSITPWSSRPSTPRINSPQGAREELVDLLSENVYLNELLSAAIADGKVGLGNLEKYLQQRLEDLASDLHRLASSKTEAEIAKFVRYCSQYTARQLVLRQDPQRGRLTSEMLSQRARQSRQEVIGRSLLTEFERPEDLNQPDDIEEVVSYPDFRAQFERIRRFILEGDPYRKWIERIEEYVYYRRLQFAPLPKDAVDTNYSVGQGVRSADARALDVSVNRVEANSSPNVVDFLRSLPNMRITLAAALAPLSLIDRTKETVEHMLESRLAAPDFTLTSLNIKAKASETF